MENERLAKVAFTFLSMGLGGTVTQFEKMPSLGKEDVQESEVGFSERLGSNSVGRINGDEDDAGLDIHAIFKP